jgi:hypothetical protein
MALRHGSEAGRLASSCEMSSRRRTAISDEPLHLTMNRTSASGVHHTVSTNQALTDETAAQLGFSIKPIVGNAQPETVVRSITTEQLDPLSRPPVELRQGSKAGGDDAAESRQLTESLAAQRI